MQVKTGNIWIKSRWNKHLAFTDIIQFSRDVWLIAYPRVKQTQNCQDITAKVSNILCADLQSYEIKIMSSLCQDMSYPLTEIEHIQEKAFQELLSFSFTLLQVIDKQKTTTSSSVHFNLWRTPKKWLHKHFNLVFFTFPLLQANGIAQYEVCGRISHISKVNHQCTGYKKKKDFHSHALLYFISTSSLPIS